MYFDFDQISHHTLRSVFQDQRSSTIPLTTHLVWNHRRSLVLENGLLWKRSKRPKDFLDFLIDSWKKWILERNLIFQVFLWVFYKYIWSLCLVSIKMISVVWNWLMMWNSWICEYKFRIRVNTWILSDIVVNRKKRWR